jgi:mannose-6-phosphate isomerase-like protein (cupin superfamily)
MTNEKMIRGANFAGFHAGPKNGWAKYGIEPPDVPRPAKGNLFLRQFLHKLQENDEVYVVVGGRGQFLVDGECIDVEEGSVLRISPPAARAWWNNSDPPLRTIKACGPRSGGNRS